MEASLATRDNVMLFKTYKGCIIEGKKSEYTVSYYETPFSDPVRWKAKSLQAAKVSITKFITMQTNTSYAKNMRTKLKLDGFKRPVSGLKAHGKGWTRESIKTAQIGFKLP